jgi:pimeloyl-ACP methyl ester carboxylesterase
MTSTSKESGWRITQILAWMAGYRLEWNNAPMMRPPLPRLAGESRPARTLGSALALGAAALLGAAGTGAAATAARSGGVVLNDCRLAHPAGLGSVPARCGSLTVAEDPDDPGGRRIALHVAVVPALDRRRPREPLFIVAGGPGQAATDFYAVYASAFAAVQRTRDLVLLDQRGTGGSNRLSCDFPDDFELSMPVPARIRELSAECRRGLAGRPQFYTTSIAVRDLEAVRAALSYERINLYGVSYGTRVVQHYVRRYAAHTRAVVLDGVVAPDRTLGPETPFDAQRALDLMFERCHREPACDLAFPDLARRFERLRAELAARPHSVTLPDPSTGEPRTLEFDALQLAGAVRLLNYASVTSALLPLFIDRATHGDYGSLAAQLLMFSAHLDAQLAYGMNAAVACSEDVPAIGRVDRAALGHTYLGAEQLDGLVALCEGWPRGVVDADLFMPLSSAVPALLLSGEADPVTPPASGARAARGFSDSLHVVVPGQGHGQLAVPCAARVIAAFLDAGTGRGLDASCLLTAAPVPFVIDPSGPLP